MQLPLTIVVGAHGRSEPLLHGLSGVGLGFVHHDATRQGVRLAERRQRRAQVVGRPAIIAALAGGLRPNTLVRMPRTPTALTWGPSPPC